MTDLAPLNLVDAKYHALHMLTRLALKETTKGEAWDLLHRVKIHLPLLGTLLTLDIYTQLDLYDLEVITSTVVQELNRKIRMAGYLDTTREQHEKALASLTPVSGESLPAVTDGAAPWARVHLAVAVKQVNEAWIETTETDRWARGRARERGPRS